MYKPEWLSEGAELLLERWGSGNKEPYDVVIVGSGYGGAVAAARLAGGVRKDGNNTKLRVCVLERGREHLPGTFPNSFSQLPGHMRYSRFDDPAPSGVRDGLFDLRIGADVTVLVANGLGGGSLINAGVAAIPDADVFQDAQWPELIRKEWGDQDGIDRFFKPLQDKLGAHDALSKVKNKDRDLKKHKAFLKFTAAAELSGDGAAKITVDPKECVQCGDCATGCNVGAKNTLSTNYLAHAADQKAEIYTGATVSHLEKRDREWAIFLELTNQPRPLQKETLHEIRARTVILAAGALGSTEILMRSSSGGRKLRLSKWLGKRFSTNGDMISALLHKDPNTVVNAAPKTCEALANRQVGPTITGIARSGDRRSNRIVVEELAIPGALRRVFEEVVTTTVMLHNLGKRDPDEHEPHSDNDPALCGRPANKKTMVDPAAVDPDIVERCQIFAAMGDDGAKGNLELVPGWDDERRSRRSSDGAIRVHWRDAGKADIFGKQDSVLCRTDLGTYLRNPLWKPIPKDLSKALSGEMPGGLLFSVHPLGGCPMADSVDKGVVDHMGRVFDPQGGVHDGLLVLDGSIVPTALGINPLLTITALAERAINEYVAKSEDWNIPEQAGCKIPQRKKALLPVPYADPPEPDKQTELQFAERMTGELSFNGGPSPKMQAELTLEFEPIALAEFLRKPLHPLEVREGTLKIRKPAQDGHVEDDWQEAKVLEGRVELLVLGATNPIDRTYGALLAYWKARGMADLISTWRERDPTPRLRGLWWRVPKGICVFLGRLLWDLNYKKSAIEAVNSDKLGRSYVALASRVGELRHLFYEFTLDKPLTDSAGNSLPLELKGRKTLCYAVGANPWRQLTNLTLTAEDKNRGRILELGTLTVDPAYFFHGFTSRLEIVRQRDLPTAWMDLASLALFLARIILKIHFWNFRLPEYQPYDPMRDLRRLPGELRPLRMERHVVGYPETPSDAGIFLPITRYRAAEKCSHGPVVLLHGLGSGGIQFATPWVSPNLAMHLAKKGFDVWVAELRTSIALPSSLDQWSIDEVAHGDIPRVVDFVLDKTETEQVDVVAHCIGSAMFCTAVLGGKLQGAAGKSKVRRAALLQVGPLITLSKGTRLRGLVTAPLRRFFPDGHVDFSVDERAGWVEAMIDRLLTTYPYPPEEAAHHRLRCFGKHNRHISNCNRWAAIDGRMIEHDNVTPKMLDHLGEVLGHSSLTTWTQTIQYAFLERLTDSDAKNAYVTRENVRDYFTFPVRFLHGTKNDVFDPLTSWRSCELIQRVHGPAAAEVELLDGYSHFDPLIGKNAERDVFGRVSCFLMYPREGHIAPGKPQAPKYYVRRPLVGPVLGWTRWDKATSKWLARVWCRIDDLRSPATFVVLVVAKGGRTLRVIECSAGDGPARPDVGPIDTTFCVDVELGSESGRYEIIVLSAHEAGEAVDPAPVLTEIAAGKRRSAPRPHLPLDDSGRPLSEVLMEFENLKALRRLAHGHADDPGRDDKIDSAAVRIPKQPESDTLSIAVASCRYPGWLFDRRLADETFGHLSAKLADGEQEPAALFLIGDQIYADATAGAFDPKDRRERFYDAYREAWTAKNAQCVLSRLPVYMMMDDHEAGDNWHPQDFCSEERVVMREEGIEAYRRYQWVHSPGNDGHPKPSDGAQEHYYYSFKLLGFPVFVCDTRTGRWVVKSGRRGMLSTEQFECLSSWLRNAQRDFGNKPKFVVSPSVVVPFLEEATRYPDRSDGWDSFPEQLAELFSLICRERVENVVFLCGDSHLSMRSEISFPGVKGSEHLKAHCIMASPMYAPYPFANSGPEQYLPKGRLELPGIGRMEYEVIECTAGDSYTLVSAKLEDGTWRIEAEVCPRRPQRTERVGAVMTRVPSESV